MTQEEITLREGRDGKSDWKRGALLREREWGTVGKAMARMEYRDRSEPGARHRRGSVLNTSGRCCVPQHLENWMPAT